MEVKIVEKSDWWKQQLLRVPSSLLNKARDTGVCTTTTPIETLLPVLVDGDPNQIESRSP
jgi:hypothetical protein